MERFWKKYSDTKYLKNYSSCSMRTDRRADIATGMSKLKITFRNFPNAPNNEWIYTSSSIIYTECNRRNGPDFGRVFLMLNHTEKPQNTHIQS